MAQQRPKLSVPCQETGDLGRDGGTGSILSRDYCSDQWSELSTSSLRSSKVATRPQDTGFGWPGFASSPGVSGASGDSNEGADQVGSGALSRLAPQMRRRWEVDT